VIRAGVLLAALTLVLPQAAQAEHEVYYRYVVLGYVKDARGTPVARAHVELVRDKTTFSYLDDTDAQGFFVLVARLGDESVGETLTLKVGATSMRIIARFDAANHTEARGTRVDLEGARFVERAGSFPSTLARFLESPTR
jgi:hypothetical protein